MLKKYLILVSVGILLASSYSFGKDDPVCGVVSQYSAGIKNNLDLYEVFSDLSLDEEVFFPKSEEEHPNLGFKLLIQSDSYRLSVDIPRWKKIIEGIEGISKTVRVKKFKADMNNNGDIEDVVQVAWRGARKGPWTRLNYVVDDFNNISPDFVSNGRAENIAGEVIGYRGIFYTVRAYDYGVPTLEVNRLNKKPIPNRSAADGFFKGLTVCKLAL